MSPLTRRHKEEHEAAAARRGLRIAALTDLVRPVPPELLELVPPAVRRASEAHREALDRLDAARQRYADYAPSAKEAEMIAAAFGAFAGDDRHIDPAPIG